MAAGSVNKAVESGNRPRVLVVEDSPALATALAEQLDRLGYDCACAGSCAEGREAASQNGFACALIDLGLPDGHGVDLVAEFRKSHPLMVPVILTGDNKTETIIETMRAGAFDYLLKPIDFTTLRAGISRAYTHYEAIHERAALTDLLREERDQLKVRIDEATKDIRDYARSCEASNALLHGLVRLTQLSSEFHTDEGLMRSVFEEINQHVELKCAAVCDLNHAQFMGALPGKNGTVEVVVSQEDGLGVNVEQVLASSNATLLPNEWVHRHTGLNTENLKPVAFPQQFGNRVAWVVAFYFPSGFSPDEAVQEFLGMCAHFVAFEWQRGRLLLHAAQHASLGNIALELTKSFMQSLTSVQTATDFMQEMELPDEASEGLSIVAKNVADLTSQTKLFRELSNERPDTVETVHLEEYIDNTLSLLAMAIRNRGLDVQRNFETTSECVLLNGTALARTFLDLISSAVRTVEPGGQIHLTLKQTEPDHILCEIEHGNLEADLFGVSGDTAEESVMERIKGHPSFMLAQRTVQSCGGRLTFERNGSGQSAFRVLLPRNALNSPSIEESKR